MKAIIMAGGEGSRLRPLTCDCPKPMLQLMGKPLMEYALQGITNQLFAAKYQLYLPKREELQAQLDALLSNEE